MKTFLIGATLFIGSIIGLESCQSRNQNNTTADAGIEKVNRFTIKDDTLASFMLAGVYFFQGFGGTTRTFNNIRREMKKTPGDEGFAEELKKVYIKMMVYPYHRSVKDKAESIQMLAQWWQINNAHEFHELLEQLLDKGHEALFEQLKKVLDENGGANAVVEKIDVNKYHLEPEATVLLQFIKNNYTSFGPSGIKAWDIVRYAQIVCMGYSAEYITDIDGFAYLKKALTSARATYNSWNSYYKDFTLGRRFWGADTATTTQLQTVITDMQQGDYSIYQYLPLK